jgi:hypothetical protein
VLLPAGGPGLSLFLALFSHTLLFYTLENTGTWVFLACPSAYFLNLGSKRARPQAYSGCKPFDETPQPLEIILF